MSEPHDFVCVICRAETFRHPGQEDCESKDGYCIHLTEARWLPVQMRVTVATSGRCVAWIGGWIGPACATRYGARAPNPRRRTRSQESSH